MNLASLHHINRVGLRQVVETMIGGSIGSGSGGSGSGGSGDKKEEVSAGDGMCQ